jgi:hypothetical protein
MKYKDNTLNKMFLNRIVKGIISKWKTRTYSTCNYVCNYKGRCLFSPAFSAFFFGGLYTYGILINNGSCVIMIRSEIQELKKEINQFKEQVKK